MKTRSILNSILDQHVNNYPVIDWVMLANAVQHYTSLGFVQVEVPWCVPEELNVATKPHSDRSFVQSNGIFANDPHELVGSAEQGFMYLIQINNLCSGKYLSVSPCFRFDDYDATHFPWFMKVELCEILDKDADANAILNKMVNTCVQFFNTILQPHDSFYNPIRNITECKVVAIDDTYDIEVNGIEIGSYGIRTTSGVRYVYGTGLALPRLTIAKK